MIGIADNCVRMVMATNAPYTVGVRWISTSKIQIGKDIYSERWYKNG